MDATDKLRLVRRRAVWIRTLCAAWVISTVAAATGLILVLANEGVLRPLDLASVSPLLYLETAVMLAIWLALSLWLQQWHWVARLCPGCQGSRLVRRYRLGGGIAAISVATFLAWAFLKWAPRGLVSWLGSLTTVALCCAAYAAAIVLNVLALKVEILCLDCDRRYDRIPT